METERRSSPAPPCRKECLKGQNHPSLCLSRSLRNRTFGEAVGFTVSPFQLQIVLIEAKKWNWKRSCNYVNTGTFFIQVFRCIHMSVLLEYIMRIMCMPDAWSQVSDFLELELIDGGKLPSRVRPEPGSYTLHKMKCCELPSPHRLWTTEPSQAVSRLHKKQISISSVPCCNRKRTSGSGHVKVPGARLYLRASHTQTSALYCWFMCLTPKNSMLPEQSTSEVALHAICGLLELWPSFCGHKTSLADHTASHLSQSGRMLLLEARPQHVW